MVSIEAIYENGHLRLLDAVSLQEGQRVKIQIEPANERDLLQTILGDSVIWANPEADIYPEVEAEFELIQKAFQGLRPLSEIIIEERGEQL